MNRLLAAIVIVAVVLAASAGAAQVGAPSSGFGPEYGMGAFQMLSKGHRYDVFGNAIAEDSDGRLLVLSSWRDGAADFNRDCALTRMRRNARMVDMDFGDALEATARITLDRGGTHADYCIALATDPLNRPIVAGHADTSGSNVAFVARLTEDGVMDTAFSSDGELALTFIPFIGVESRFNDVVALSNSRVLACGYVTRGSERNMLIVKTTASGSLDISFNDSGYNEIDFNGGGGDNDMCSQLLVLPTGDIVLGGTASSFAGRETFAFARLDADGVLDAQFSGDGRLRVDDGAVTLTSIEDMAYDPARSRLIAVGNNRSVNGPIDGEILAITDGGVLDTSYSLDGRRSLRFSDLPAAISRQAGATSLKRLPLLDDGTFYLIGTHYNNGSDITNFGTSDIAFARISIGALEPIGGSTTAVVFPRLLPPLHSNVAAENQLKIDDSIKDAIYHRGQALVLSDSNRYPAGTYPIDGTTQSVGKGPLVPVVAALQTHELFKERPVLHRFGGSTGALRRLSGHRGARRLRPLLQRARPW